jgi:hypothetical protein
VYEEGVDMLRDHWPFNEDELLRLLDLCFGWKADGREAGVGREVLLVRLSGILATLSKTSLSIPCLCARC